MRWIRFVVLLLIVTILQAQLVDIIAIKSVTPNLFSILLVFFAVYSHIHDVIIVSFVIGLAADLISIAPMGPQIIAFSLFGTLLAYLRQVVSIRRPFYQAAAIFIINILIGAGTHLLNLIKTHSAPPNIYNSIFWTSLYSAVIGPFLFPLCARLMRVKTSRFTRH